MSPAHINPTADELDALTPGSIAIIQDDADDQWPEAFLRYGSGWTRLEAGTSDNDIPSAGLLVRPEQIVTVVWDAANHGTGGRTVTEEEELLALPEGALVRGVAPGHNPAWPKLLLRAHTYLGGEFIPSSPDAGHDPVPAGAAARYYGDLTVVWEPQRHPASSSPGIGNDPIPATLHSVVTEIREPAPTKETYLDS